MINTYIYYKNISQYNSLLHLIQHIVLLYSLIKTIPGLFIPVKPVALEVFQQHFYDSVKERIIHLS